MRVCVVGSGLSGTIFAKTFREYNPEAQIEIFAEEPHLYYPRPNLIEYLAGNLEYERLFPFRDSWFHDQNIQFHAGRPVERIDPGASLLHLRDGKEIAFDLLCLADGARAFIPPIPGSDLDGVQSLRTLDDTQELIRDLPRGGKTVLIGGGLLGLEIARGIKSRGGEIVVVEFFPRLLPRQLDEEGASLLKTQVESLGIDVILGAATEKIEGNSRVERVCLKDGKIIDAARIVIAAGIRPSIELARSAGLKTDKGVLVDDAMRTSHPRIYAAGDNTQHRDRLYGIIPAAFQQAKIAAANASGLDREYFGTVPSNTLKVLGLSVTSAGIVNPETGAYEQIRTSDPDRGRYKKIVLDKGHLVGAIWMGTKLGANEIVRFVTENKNVEKWKKSILKENFDFTGI